MKKGDGYIQPETIEEALDTLDKLLNLYDEACANEVAKTINNMSKEDRKEWRRLEDISVEKGRDFLNSKSSKLVALYKVGKDPELLIKLFTKKELSVDLNFVKEHEKSFNK